MIEIEMGLRYQTADKLSGLLRQICYTKFVDTMLLQDSSEDYFQAHSQSNRCQTVRIVTRDLLSRRL
jgi:hypothetical protein